MTLSTADSTPLETSDTDSVSVKKQLFSVTGRADEPPTDLSRSSDNQIVLYSLKDMGKADLFQIWWDLTPFGVELATRRRAPKWGQQSTHKTSAWPYFIEGANIMQGEPRVICKLCEGNLAHPSTKSSGTKALWNHLESVECERKGERPPLLQQLLDSRVKKVSFYHTDLSHLLILLRSKQMNILTPFGPFLNLIRRNSMTTFCHLFLKQISLFAWLNMTASANFFYSAGRICRFHIEPFSRQLLLNDILQRRKEYYVIFHHHVNYLLP
jgi:hypothetical protein